MSEAQKILKNLPESAASFPLYVSGGRLFSWVHWFGERVSNEIVLCKTGSSSRLLLLSM